MGSGSAEDQRTAEVSRVVRARDTASAYGPEFPPAAATPFVLGLAELACHKAVADDLRPGEVTVGVAASIEHLEPTAEGKTLRAFATLVERDGRRLLFKIIVEEDGRAVARLEHRRVITTVDRITARMASKTSASE